MSSPHITAVPPDPASPLALLQVDVSAKGRKCVWKAQRHRKGTAQQFWLRDISYWTVHPRLNLGCRNYWRLRGIYEKYSICVASILSRVVVGWVQACSMSSKSPSQSAEYRRLPLSPLTASEVSAGCA